MKKLIYLILLISLICGCSRQDMDHNQARASHYQQDAENLLKMMTLDEKIGQLVAYTSNWDVTGPLVSNDNESYIREGLCGNIFNAHEVNFNRKLQEIAVNETRLGIPLLFGYDVIHGYRTIFPISLGESASWNMELIEKAARTAAEEASACGVNWTFAPMVDISFDPRWGRVSESAGEDPFLGSVIARSKVRGFQGNDLTKINTILACVKHFAAYGAPEAGRDYNTVDMSDRSLREYYLPPYKAAVEENVASVMTSFNELNGVPSTANAYLLDKILRKEWGFKGFVVTDYNSIVEMISHGFAPDSSDAALKAMNAGVDMDMESSAFRKFLGKLVQEGHLSSEVIDHAVLRVLEAKYKLGLFDDPYKYFDLQRQENLLLTDENLKLAYELASESLVLLKNDKNLLPLSKGSKVAVIGPHAALQRDLLGSWIADGKWDNIQTIKSAIEELNGLNNTKYSKGCWFDKTDRSGFEEAKKMALRSDAIILTMGESWHWSGEAASRTSIRLPEIQTELIRELKKLNKPIILVLLNGRPLALEEEYPMVDAILEAWFPGTKGAEAIADALFGNIIPSGKLTMTFPRNLGQVPIHYNVKNTGRPVNPDNPDYKYTSRYLDSKNEPLFPFGYGLSYSTFNYSDLKLSTTSLKAGDDLVISVKLSNTGSKEAKEVVQLYIRDLVGSVTRPVKELKGFRKVKLKPGEMQTVTFTISEDDLKFYRLDMTYGSEPGKFKVFVGGNSQEVLEDEFNLLD